VLCSLIHDELEGPDNDNTAGDDDKDKFLPDPVLKGNARKDPSIEEDLLSKEYVEATLEYLIHDDKGLRMPAEGLSGMIDFIRTDARKIFTALVLAGATCHIQRFHSKRLGDAVLPVTRKRHVVRSCNAGDPEQAEKVKQVFSLTRGIGSDGTVPGWEVSQITSFCDWQWAVLAPVFKAGAFNHKFPSSIRLPYTTYEAPETQESETMVTEKHRNGGFGDVQDRCIHQQHLIFGGEVR